MDHHSKKIREKLSRYLKGKRVVVVGPAQSVVGSGQGKLIDSYDVVVRLNKALPVSKSMTEDIGSRTDILYNCMNPSDECGGIIPIGLLQKLNVKFVVGAYPPLERVGQTKLRIKSDNLEFFQKSKKNFRNFCYTDKNYFLNMWKIMKLPNTGTMTILDLLRFEIKELYITGITFFKGGYIRTYRDYDEEGILTHMKKFNLHKPERQLNYMCKKLSTDPRVKMDSTLKDIVDSQCLKLKETKEEDILNNDNNLNQDDNNLKENQSENLNINNQDSNDKDNQDSNYKDNQNDHNLGEDLNDNNLIKENSNDNNLNQDLNDNNSNELNDHNLNESKLDDNNLNESNNEDNNLNHDSNNDNNLNESKNKDLDDKDLNDGNNELDNYSDDTIDLISSNSLNIYQKKI